MKGVTTFITEEWFTIMYDLMGRALMARNDASVNIAV